MSEKFLAERFDETMQPDFIPNWLKINTPKEFVIMLVGLFWTAEFVILFTEFCEKL